MWITTKVERMEINRNWPIQFKLQTSVSVTSWADAEPIDGVGGFLDVQVHLQEMWLQTEAETTSPARETAGKSSNSIVKGRKRTQLLPFPGSVCAMKGLALHGAPQESSSVVRSCLSTGLLAPGVAGTPKQKCGSDGGTVVGRVGMSTVRQNVSVRPCHLIMLAMTSHPKIN